MFTGIVEERGAVREVGDHRLVVGCSVVPADSGIGASVAVNGVCLTVVGNDGASLAFDLSDETLACTSLRRLALGDPVNLERPVSLAARLGGHMVQGHVDGVGVVMAVDPDEGGGARLRIEVPSSLLRYVVDKGSVTVDGVSLTIAQRHEDGITIALIPHTLAVTTLGTASPGDPVNLEVDVIAKYVERLMEGTHDE
ncbi:MAG: riboflavin synthase [Actinomycetota bacterium]